MVPKRIVAAALLLLLVVPYVHAQERVTDQNVWRSYAERLEPNAYVRVRLTSGKSFKGHVVAVSDAGLRVNPRTRVAAPLRDCPYGDIVSIDLQREPRWNPAVKVLLGVGIGVGTVLLLSMIALVGAYD